LKVFRWTKRCQDSALGVWGFGFRAGLLGFGLRQWGSGLGFRVKKFIVGFRGMEGKWGRGRGGREGGREGGDTLTLSTPPKKKS
jgi:hypothetical protein